MEYNIKVEDNKKLLYKFNNIGNNVLTCNEHQVIISHKFGDIISSLMNDIDVPVQTYNDLTYLLEARHVSFKKVEDSLLIYQANSEVLSLEEVKPEGYQLPTHRKPYREELNKFKEDKLITSKEGKLIRLLARCLCDSFDVVKGMPHLRNIITPSELNYFNISLEEFGGMSKVYETKEQLVNLLNAFYQYSDNEEIGDSVKRLINVLRNRGVELKKI